MILEVHTSYPQVIKELQQAISFGTSLKMHAGFVSVEFEATPEEVEKFLRILKQYQAHIQQVKVQEESLKESQMRRLLELGIDPKVFASFISS